MARERILVVEDERDILDLIKYNLEKDGYQVTAVITGEAGLDSARSSLPDLILLDLMLPGLDGLDVCRLLKGDPKTQHIPIVMLTAKGEDADIVSGLEIGAQDYIVKPFSPRVLVARLRAILRRKSEEPSKQTSTIRHGDITIHPGRHEVIVNDAIVSLTATEFRLLHFLARRPGWVFTRAQIVSGAHGDDTIVTDRSIDVQIAGLRRKLGQAGKYIETVRGVGYRFME